MGDRFDHFDYEPIAAASLGNLDIILYPCVIRGNLCIYLCNLIWCSFGYTCNI